jgi:subtilase family serine protease
LDEEGNYTNKFGGTSSATPLVAGIAALMLSINEDLTLTQVKDILMKTADKIGDSSTYSYNETTGLTHSDYFGYGRVNALRAVQMAEKLNTTTRQMVTNHQKIIKYEKRKTILSQDRIIEKDQSLWLNK